MFSFFVLPLLTMGLLGGCLHPKPEETKSLTYLSKDPLFLPVEQISFCFPPCSSDNIRVSNVSLVDMLHQWGKTYLKSSSETPYHLTISFNNIVIEERVVDPEKKGMSALLYIQSREKYTASLDVLCVLRKPGSEKTMTIHIDVEEDIPETYSPLERKTILLSLYTDIINRITKNIEEKLYKFILNN